MSMAGPILMPDRGSHRRRVTASTGPIVIQNIKSDAYTVYTNTVPAGAFRGMGTPQVVWAYESQMDMIADELGLDPVEFRLKNLLERGDEFSPR